MIMIITSGVFQVSSNIVALNIAFSKISNFVLSRFTVKVLLSLLNGVFRRKFTNLQFLRRLLHLYIMSIQKHNFFFTVNLTFVKTSCTFSRLYSLFMMFNIRKKVFEFIITKDSCIFGVNRMQCVRKYKIGILYNVCY